MLAYPTTPNALKRPLRAACEGVESVLQQSKLLDHVEGEILV